MTHVSAPVSQLTALRFGARLGRGGMSQVWAATTAAGTPVAVKVSNPDMVDRAAARALIRREHAFVSRLSHRNIVSVLGLVEAHPTQPDQGLGLVMEYVGGGDLVSLAGSRPAQWIPVAAQVARALAYLHGAGLVHRDVKARNVLLRPGDEACLIDFGLAAALGGPALRGGGTAAYQSANQRRGGPPEVGDDVHAFAALVYELWTGTLPFGGEPPLATLEGLGEQLRPLGTTEGSEGLRRLADLVVDALRGRTPPDGIGVFADALELAVNP